MKKIIPIATIMLFVFASCSKVKDWTCQCNISSTGQPTTAGGPLLNQEKSEAAAACQKFEDDGNANQPNLITCTLEEVDE